MNYNRLILTLIIILFFYPLPAAAETITLLVPVYKDGSHRYYHDLLKASLEAKGHRVILIFPSRDLPQKRAIKMLDEGSLSLSWMLETKERNKRYTPVHIGITGNLIGHRILLIPKDTQSIYSRINTLEDFKQANIVGGFGENWFDITVWEKNNLPYFIQSGDWRSLFMMVAAKDRGVDYISRGINEIVIEANQYPYLDIEQTLMLIYDRDFIFYLSRKYAKYKNEIEEALTGARQSGLMNRLIDKHWGNVIKDLHIDQRTKIILETPK